MSHIIKIDKQSGSVEKLFPVRNSYSGRIAVDSLGHMFRAGEGSMTYIDDTVFLGNYDRSAVMLFYYDSSLDTRRRSCPQAEAPRIVSSQGRSVTLAWHADAHQEYELAYAPEGTGWDDAAILRLSDTTATIDLPADGCHLFRLRGLCPSSGQPLYGPWSDSLLFCPSAGIYGSPAAQAPAFTLAPNPADGAVTVTVEGAGLAAATITVTDLAGKQMLHQAVAGPQFTIPDAQLAPGIYFVTLATPQGTSTQKLVVTD